MTLEDIFTERVVNLWNFLPSLVVEAPSLIIVLTSSSAIVEGPRDALSQLKSCQLLHN